MSEATTQLTRADRLARVRFALAESAIGSTSGVLTWLAACYRFEPDRAAHVHRVARTSLSIGDRLDLPREQLRHVERAALLHDVGRLIVPDGECRADDGPQGRRAQQALAAQDALAVVPVLHPAAEIVGALWERVDGTGWPKGLTADGIPIGARIVSVADALDALTSLSVEMALPVDAMALELVQHAGTRFDPVVVAAVVRWLDTMPLGVPSLEMPTEVFV